MSQEQAEYNTKDPRQIIQEISGFYPLFEALVSSYNDLITPAVFGVVWRFCQMPDGVCRASLRKIAGILNVDEVTVMRRLKTLCDDGYLIDTTPDLRNSPHVYVDAGRVVMKNSLGVSSETVSHRSKSVSHRNATVSKSQLIKDTNKESNKAKKEKKAATPQPPEILVFREVVKHYPKQAQREAVIAAIQKISARLLRPVTADDLTPYWQAWAVVSGNEWSLVWLVEWAVAGKLPASKNAPQQKPAEPKAFDAIRKFLGGAIPEEQEYQNG